jgi:hypothetical protein
LPPNAIRHTEGVYLDGIQQLVIRFTEEEFLVPESWLTGLCGASRVRFTLEGERLYYAYNSEEGWAVLFDVPENYGKTCAFIERFLQRLRYFKNVSKDVDSVPFPAIVEIP